MNRYAVINASNIVVNIIKWDGKSLWSPPKNHIAVASDSARIDDTYDPIEKTFTRKGA
jgi:hypothetical protein